MRKCRGHTINRGLSLGSMVLNNFSIDSGDKYMKVDTTKICDNCHETDDACTCNHCEMCDAPVSSFVRFCSTDCYLEFNRIKDEKIRLEV